MCGRYKLTAHEEWLSFLFNLDREDVDWVDRWEVPHKKWRQSGSTAKSLSAYLD
jgi:hypothetical protein